MYNLKTHFEQLYSILRLSGYRLTPQRIELLRLIVNSDDHPNAARLFEQVKVKFPTMSLATVYKTLDLLRELDEVVEISLHNDNHFEANRPYPHPHLICTSCNKIVDGEIGTQLPALVDEMEHISGFKILRQQLVLYGLCPDCQKNLR
jgi:Fur family peroxide stress response transcriptional regulator